MTVGWKQEVNSGLASLLPPEAGEWKTLTATSECVRTAAVVGLLSPANGHTGQQRAHSTLKNKL